MNKYTFMGNGRNKDFYFTFSFFSKGDIVVKINGTAATGYGVFCIPANTGNNDFPFTGGHIHFATAPKSTDVVTIERKLQLNRIIDYQPTSALTPTTINQDMNYFFELLKDIKSDLTGFQETYAEFTDTESAQTLLERIDTVMDEIDTVSTQIEDLGDITTIRSTLTSLGTSVSNLTESLNTLSTTVGGHTTTIGSHTTSIGTLDTRTTGMLDYVIASQAPTSTNDYTWYRKYKSGWIEMGGKASSKTVNLPVTMANTNYSCLINTLYDSASNTLYNELGYLTSQTTTSFTKSGNATIFQWVVYGEYAQ